MTSTRASNTAPALLAPSFSRDSIRSAIKTETRRQFVGWRDVHGTPRWRKMSMSKGWELMANDGESLVSVYPQDIPLNFIVVSPLGNVWVIAVTIEQAFERVLDAFGISGLDIELGYER